MEMQTLRQDYCLKVECTVGTKEVKKTMLSCCMEKAGFVPHERCTPYLAHVKASPNCKVDMELFQVDILDVKIPESSGSRKGGAVKAKESSSGKRWLAK